MSGWEALKLRAKGVKGWIGEISVSGVRGWVYRPDVLDERLDLVLVCDGAACGQQVAQMLLDALVAKKRGDGRYGFEFATPAELLDGAPHRIDVRLAGTGESLLDGGVTLQASAEGLVRVEPTATGAVQLPAQTPPSPTPPAALPDPYLDDAKSLALLAAQRWEHEVEGGGGEAIARFAATLKEERASLLRHPGDPAPVSLLTVGVGAAPAGDTWSLQSYPVTSTLSAADLADSSKLAETVWCVFAREGDVIHPATAALLAGLTPTADAALWSLFSPDPYGLGGVSERRPQFDPHTLRHNPGIDTTFAVKCSALTACPAAVIAALAAGRVHPLLFWLAGQPGLRWRTFAEALTVRDDPRAAKEAGSRARLKEDLDLYYRLADMASDFDLRETADEMPIPFTMVPKRRAQRTSVIMPLAPGGRDKALQALYWIARQRLTGSVEIVFVGDGEDLTATATRMFGHDAAQTVPATPGEHPLNRAAKAARGDVLLFCDPSVLLRDDETLVEHLGAWALLPSVGATCCRMQVATERSFGLTFAASDRPYAPILTLERDEAYADTVRSCAGAPLMLAAMAREKFIAVGGVNTLDMPAAALEADLMLRSARHGLTHLFLGYLHAAAEDGVERPQVDFVAASQLRHLYPDQFESAPFALKRHAVRREQDASGAGALLADVARLAKAASRRGLSDETLRQGVLAELTKVTQASGELLSAMERLQALVAKL